MIGLKFRVKNEYNNFLYKIFYSVNVQSYEWEIITDDIVDSGEMDGIFCSEFVDGQRFFDRIGKESYYMIFVDLKAYYPKCTHVEIKNFEEFLESECKIIFLCVDSELIEIYCKEKSILEKVHENCQKFHFEDVKYISKKEASKRNMIAF